jgi:hypothetical protein
MPGTDSNSNAPVEVNFDIQIDASGTVEVLGEAPEVQNNVVVAEVKLPVATLYDASNSFFEFKEPADRSDIFGQLSANGSEEGRDYKTLVEPLVLGLQNTLTGVLDASAAFPFSEYNTVEAYYKPTNFGELALAAYAHYMFGHVAATAAITNDEAFVARMNSDASGSESLGENVDASGAPTAVPDELNAYLAHRLVAALIASGNANATKIAKQVISQDASRAMDQDNNELTPEGWHELKFIADDVIYMRIKLAAPKVEFGPSSSANKVTAEKLEGKYAPEEGDDVYTIKITLV